MHRGHSQYELEPVPTFQLSISLDSDSDCEIVQLKKEGTVSHPSETSYLDDDAFLVHTSESIRAGGVKNSLLP